MSEASTTTGASNPENPNRPQDPEWRARYVPRGEQAPFTDLYQTGQQVYISGRRGWEGPYTIRRALGNGQYELASETGVLPGIYNEADLIQNPNATSARGV